MARGAVAQREVQARAGGRVFKLNGGSNGEVDGRYTVSHRRPYRDNAAGQRPEIGLQLVIRPGNQREGVAAVSSGQRADRLALRLSTGGSGHPGECNHCADKRLALAVDHFASHYRLASLGRLGP